MFGRGKLLKFGLWKGVELNAGSDRASILICNRNSFQSPQPHCRKNACHCQYTLIYSYLSKLSNKLSQISKFWSSVAFPYHVPGRSRFTQEKALYNSSGEFTSYLLPGSFLLAMLSSEMSQRCLWDDSVTSFDRTAEQLWQRQSTNKSSPEGVTCALHKALRLSQDGTRVIRKSNENMKWLGNANQCIECAHHFLILSLCKWGRSSSPDMTLYFQHDKIASQQILH